MRSKLTNRCSRLPATVSTPASCCRCHTPCQAPQKTPVFWTRDASGHPTGPTCTATQSNNQCHVGGASRSFWTAGGWGNASGDDKGERQPEARVVRGGTV